MRKIKIMQNKINKSTGGGSLIEIYIAAIPFDFRLLLSTSLYLLLFNSLEKFVKADSQHNKKILDS